MLLCTKLMQFFALDIAVEGKFYFGPALLQQILRI